MKKTWFLVLVVLILAITLTGCSTLGGGKQAQQQTPKASEQKAEITLRLGYGQPTSNPRHITAEKYANWVSEQTKGKVKVQLFPAEMLGTDKQMTEMASMGSLDMVITAQGVLSSYEPKLAGIGLPFLFDSMDKVGKVLDGPIGDELAKDLPSKGIRLLAYWDNGLRQVTNSKRPIEQPADLKGLKIRTPEDKMTLSIFKALGANPAPLAFPELYLALSQGVFDGQENPVVNIHSSKFYEVQKYISLTNHKYEACPLIISEKTWRKLPPDVQKVMKEGAVKFAAEHRKMDAENEGKLLADLEAKGMKVSKPNLAPFREATKSVYDEWIPVLGKDLLERIMAAAK